MGTFFVRDGEFDSDTFLGAELIRNVATMLNNYHRKPKYVDIHYIDCTARDFPLAVRNFVALGDKLVPSQSMPSFEYRAPSSQLSVGRGLLRTRAGVIEWKYV